MNTTQTQAQKAAKEIVKTHPAMVAMAKPKDIEGLLELAYLMGALDFQIELKKINQ